MEALELKYEAMRREIEEAGLYGRTYGYYLVLGLFVFLGYAGSLYAITLTDNVWFQIGNAVFFAFIIGQAGMLGHDLSHGQVFNSRFLNRFCSKIVFGLFNGLCESQWHTKHNAHHAHPNQAGHDPDLDMPFIFSFEEQGVHQNRFFMQHVVPYQHVLFFLVLPLIYFSLVFHSWVYLFRHFHTAPNVLFFEMILAASHFIVLFSVLFTFLPLMIAIIFIAMHTMFGGLYMSLVFAPNHKGEEVTNRHAHITWINQITSTRNIYPSWLVFHVFGGLGFQIEHHLFSDVPRPHYWGVHRIVKRFCGENSIPFHETTWLGSMREIYFSLKVAADATWAKNSTRNV